MPLLLNLLFLHNHIILVSKWSNLSLTPLLLVLAHECVLPSLRSSLVENLKQNLSKEIGRLEKQIDALWDNKDYPIEERGRLIDLLNKKRISLSQRIQDIILHELRLVQSLN